MRLALRLPQSPSPRPLAAPKARRQQAPQGSGRPRDGCTGDSITRAFAACGRGGDCAETSWATGSAEDLDSHAQRLHLEDAVSSHNLAVNGARVAGLASQVEAAVRVRPDYVTVLIGANDACAAEEAGMA